MTYLELAVLIFGKIYVAAAGFVVLSAGLLKKDLGLFLMGSFLMAVGWGCLERYWRKVGR